MGREEGYRIETIVVGALETNCYILHDGKRAVVIDPGDEGDRIAKLIDGLNLEVGMILATHGHFDHIMAVNMLKKLYDAPFYMSRKDEEIIKKSYAIARSYLGIDPGDPPEIDRDIVELSSIDVGGEKFKIIETPGHTPGSVCILGSRVIFTGDTLFAGGIGRIDFGGNPHDMVRSLRMLRDLPDDLLVYPGHGNPTSIGHEKNNNPYMINPDILVRNL